MLIQHQHKENHGLFFIEDDGNILAEITYSNPTPDRMVIQHTEVDDELKGQNVGYSLVHHAVEYARTHGQKVVPVCSFARAVFDKKPELRDVLEE